MKTKLAIKLLVLGICLTAIPAFPAPILVTTPGALGANDSVDWAQLGGDLSSIPNSFSANSANAVVISGLFGSSTGVTSVVCPAAPSCSWTPSGSGFNAGDTLIWANDFSAGTGPLSLSFSSVLGAGLWLQPDEVGQFTGQIEAFNGVNSLGAFTVTSNAGGDPIFLGLLDSVPDITKVVFSLTACGGGSCSDPNDFAVNSLLLTETSSGVPEPSSLVLLASGLVGLGWKLRRKSTKVGRNL